MTFQRPLNSSISAMSLRISGVIVDVFKYYAWAISIFNHSYPFPTQRQGNIQFHPFAAIPYPMGGAKAACELIRS